MCGVQSAWQNRVARHDVLRDGDRDGRGERQKFLKSPLYSDLMQETFQSIDWREFVAEAPRKGCKEQGVFDRCVTDGETKEALRLLRAHDDISISKDQESQILTSPPSRNDFYFIGSILKKKK
jgi:hypothetical protein